MTDLTTYTNPTFGEIRTVTINGEPWLVGKDVADALGYKNPQEAVRNHVDDEDKGVSEFLTPGGKQKIPIINESGLYSLILSSKLPKAKEFKHWVTSEVLPAIRKTGQYASPNVAGQALAEKRANAMALNAKCRAAKQMMELWTAAGVTAEHQALALNGYYDGLEVPREALRGRVTALLDKTTIARNLGMLSTKGRPHAQAAGAIISMLTLAPEETAETPYCRNGHDGVDIQYTQSVEEKARAWLEAHEYPTTIQAGGKAFRVAYQKQ